MIQTVLIGLFKLFELRQSARVRCHRTVFMPDGPECRFINLSNLSPKRDFGITHAYLDCPGRLPVLNPQRLLPRRLQPEASRETRIGTSRLPAAVRDNACELARVRLSNGRIVSSIRNEDVPDAGCVSGGG